MENCMREGGVGEGKVYWRGQLAWRRVYKEHTHARQQRLTRAMSGWSHRSVCLNTVSFPLMWRLWPLVMSELCGVKIPPQCSWWKATELLRRWGSVRYIWKFVQVVRLRYYRLLIVCWWSRGSMVHIQYMSFTIIPRYFRERKKSFSYRNFLSSFPPMFYAFIFLVCFSFCDSLSFSLVSLFLIHLLSLWQTTTRRGFPTWPRTPASVARPRSPRCRKVLALEISSRTTN